MSKQFFTAAFINLDYFL